MKEFAHARGVKNAKEGTLSSYAYTLLCIHFLQGIGRCPIIAVESLAEEDAKEATPSVSTAALDP